MVSSGSWLGSSLDHDAGHLGGHSRRDPASRRLSSTVNRVTEQPQTPQFAFEVPDQIAAGVYSNVVAVWHSPYEFTLDF